jgi:predicted Zn-dependent protease
MPRGPERRFGRILLALAALVTAAAPGRAYNAGKERWTAGDVTMHLQLGPASAPLADGAASWGAVAESALALWNNQLTNLRFTVVRDSTVPIERGNRSGQYHNNVFWSYSIYGDAWDSRTLAITLTSYSPQTSRYVETDVVFNQNLRWDSYRGALRSDSGGTRHDFRRVALHEFGHALGLNHPDDIGQNVGAIMNAAASNTDDLTADDIAGARAIYDNPANLPTSLLRMQGSIGFSTSGPNLNLRVGQIRNEGDAASREIRLELWAMPQRYAGGLPAGSRSLGVYAFPGPLASGASLANVDVSTPYLAPPNGGYYVVLLLTEFTGGSGSGYTIRDAIEFDNPLNIGASQAPAIVSQPASLSVDPGATATFAVAANGTLPLSYQWRRNGTALSGATGTTLTLTNVQAADAGTYTVTVTNGLGAVTSDPATLSVRLARLTNVSVRSGAGTGDDTLIVGFNISGAGTKPVLLRGVGPTLVAFGVGGVVSDPQLRLFDAAGTQIDLNDDWGGDPALAAAGSAAGAFALPARSLDAVLHPRLAAGSYSVQLTTTGATGVALVEGYDTEPGGGGARLTNLSVRSRVGTGDNVLIVGFATSGSAPKTLLIRGIGPTLTSFGVGPGEVLGNPQLLLFNQAGAEINRNDDWGGATNLRNAFASVAAFPLDAGSRDAVLLVSLPPGSYTAQVSGVGNTTGVALVEVYELP